MLAMLGAAAATGSPRWSSKRCFAKVPACAELPRAHVTTTRGGARRRRAESSLTAPANSRSCRSITSGTEATSRAKIEAESPMVGSVRLQRAALELPLRKQQGSGQSISARPDELTPDTTGKKRLKATGKASHECQPWRPERLEPPQHARDR